MKHAVFRRDAIHFNLQVVHAASVQKRDLESDIINGIATANFPFIPEVVQQIETGLSQAQNTIQGDVNQVTSLVNNAVGNLQSMVTQILTEVGNAPGCATAQTANVEKMLNQTSMLLYQLF
jgi:hypothetical protein